MVENILGRCSIEQKKHFRMAFGWKKTFSVGDILRGIKTLMLQLIEFNVVGNILGWCSIGQKQTFSDGVILW